MSVYNWYEVIAKADFDALNIPSKEVEVFTEAEGLLNVLVTKGNYYSFLIDDIFISYDLNDRNPFVFEGYGIFLKDDIFYLGISE